MIFRLLYSLVMLVTIALVAWQANRNQRKLPISDLHRGWILWSAGVGALIGAKLPFLLQEGWLGLLQGNVWFADGKTILGGIFGGYLSVEFTKWILGIRVGTGDAFAIPVALACMLGRVGCFLAGCCYGIPTEWPWGIPFETAKDPPGVCRHPTQLYEVLFHGLAIVALWGIQRRGWLEGHQLKAYLLSYLLYRFFTEWIRPEYKIGGWLSFYQIACVLLATALIAQWVGSCRRQNSPESIDGAGSEVH